MAGVPMPQGVKIKKLLKEISREKVNSLNSRTIELAFRDIKEQEIDISLSASVRINEFGVTSYVLIISDITKFKQDQKKLENQLKFEKLISSIREDLSTVDKSKDFVVYEAMSKVCDYLDIDQVFIYSISKYGRLSNIHKKYVKNPNPVLKTEDEKKIFYDFVFSSTKDRKVANLNYKENEELIDFGVKIVYTQEILEELDTKYLLAYCSYDKDYLEESEILVIEMFTDIMENFFAKEYYYEIMLEKKETLDTLLENSIVGVITLDKSRIVTYINDPVAEMFKIDKNKYLSFPILKFYEDFPKLLKLSDYYYAKRKVGYKTVEMRTTLETDGAIKRLFIQAKPVMLDETESTLITFIDIDLIIGEKKK